jgi:hypothetical protein
MPRKIVTVVLYGADRVLWQGRGARLQVIDCNQGGVRVLADKALAGSTIEVDLEVPFDAGQTYVLTIDAPGHRSAWQIIWYKTFLREEHSRLVERPEAILRLMLVPDTPVSSDLPLGYSRLVHEHGQLASVWTLGGDDYRQLEPARQMALLNIEAKLRETFIGTNSILSYVSGLRGIEPDRLFAMVRPELKALVSRSPDFAGAEGHGVPDAFPALPPHPASWKHTVYSGGNLQLSFSAATEPWPVGPGAEPAFSVDMDIDLARGLGHAAEWLGNNVIHANQKTDQTQVYALLFAQGILPFYRLDQAP